MITVILHRNSHHRMDGEWTAEVRPDAPQLTEKAFAQLQRTTEIRTGDKVIAMWPRRNRGEWDAVATLYRYEHPTDALSLAKLLVWCEDAAADEYAAYWEITDQTVDSVGLAEPQAAS